MKISKDYFTFSFHDFDLNLRLMVNKQFEQMMLIIFEILHKFVAQAEELMEIIERFSSINLLLLLEQEQ